MAAANVNWIILQLLALWIKVCFSSCGDLIQGDTGDLRFPPIGEGNAGEKSDCVWIITVREQYRVKLTFTDFVMKTSCCSCVHDFLEIRDGPLDNSTLIDTFCAKKEPKYVFSSGNAIWIKFLSDFRTYSGNRFRLSYEAVCGRHYASTSGSFSSPGYPFPYGNSEDCIYSIAVPKGRIKVTFDSFSVEGRMPICLYDFLEVKEIRYVEYSSSQGLSRKRRYCGNDKPPIIYSTRGSHLWFRFKTDLSGERSGFSAYYRTISAGEGTCGGTLKDKSGFIYSQNYPYHFPSGQECTWKIQVASDMHVHLYFDTLDFGVNTGVCGHTYLEVFDELDTSSHKIGQYCGDSIPSKIVSRTNKLLIKAVSTAVMQETGWFSMRYESSTSGACGLQQFTCVDRQCIESYDECNGERQCDDGSDEEGCPDTEGSDVFTWYRFWPVSVVGGMLIVGIWLWRAWKKIVSTRSEIGGHQSSTPAPNNVEMLPCAPIELPSYCEAVAQGGRPPPSYEEALREQTDAPETERDTGLGAYTQDSMTNSTLNDSVEGPSTRHEPPSLSMVVYGVPALPYDNHGVPYDSHRVRTNKRHHAQRV